MKVRKLIEILSQCDEDMEIRGTWEGIITDIDAIYKSNNTILLDVDGGFYAPNEVIYKEGE